MVFDAPQHAQYNHPHFHGVGTFSTLHGVGTAPCFHGLGIFYGRCTLTCSVQPSSLPRCRTFSTLARCRNLFLKISMFQNLSQDSIQRRSFSPDFFFFFFYYYYLKMSNVSKYFSQDSIRRRSFSLDFYLKCQVSQNVKFFQIISPRIQFDSAHLVQNFQNYSHSLRFPLQIKVA